MTVLAAALLALAPVGAHGEEPPGSAGPPPGESCATAWETFAYEPPAPVLRLRIALEELSFVAIGFTGYLIWNPPAAYPGVPVTSIGKKLGFAPDSWAFDNDSIATNFIGHASAGIIYYAFARANRVSIPEAFLWTFGASTLWELIEFKEPMSINDVVLTPVAGFAIGEALTQLSGWFDHQDDTLSHVLAWVVDPPRKLHDWMDGATPRRDPARRGWHEFQLVLGGGSVFQESTAYPALQVAIATRLFRAPGYGEPGRSGAGFADGNVSGLTLSATFAAHRTEDLLLDTETAFLGWYARDLGRDGDGLSGWDLFAGLTVAYEYGFHVWNLAADGPKNEISMVRLPGADLRLRGFVGELEVRAAVDVALDFAAVVPLGMPTAAVLPAGVVFPTVYLANGYYFALGLHLAPAVELRLGHLAVGGCARFDSFRGFTGPFVPQADGQVASFRDGRSLVSAWMRFRLATPGLEVALRADWRDRWGEVGVQRASAQERAVIASVAWVL